MTRARGGTGVATRRRRKGVGGSGTWARDGAGMASAETWRLGVCRRRPGVSNLAAAQCLGVGSGTASCGRWRPSVLQ